jgi:hypothetical protein
MVSFAAGRLWVLWGLLGWGSSGLSAAVAAPPETLGNWRAAGVLREDRSDAAAVVLADGRVLVTGGYSSRKKRYLRSAEIWDPRSLTSRATGSMKVPRASHTATLLRDGRVLVAGGASEGPEESGTQNTAEIWDPASGKFSTTGAMQGARRLHVAVRLADGRVAVGGGGLSIPAVEMWDASSARWQVVDRQHGDEVALAALPAGGLVEVTRSRPSGTLVARRWEGHGEPEPLATLTTGDLRTVFAVDDTHVVVVTDDDVTVWNPRSGQTRRAPHSALGPDASLCWSRVQPRRGSLDVHVRPVCVDADRGHQPRHAHQRPRGNHQAARAPAIRGAAGRPRLRVVEQPDNTPLDAA